jgi:hypothetical protein
LNPTIFGKYSSAYFTLLAGLATLLALGLLAHAPFFYRTLHRFRWEVILLFSGLFASLIIVEVAVRSFDLLGISYFEESTRYQLDMVPDPVLVYRHAPRLRKIYQGVAVSTNELGLRDRELERKQDKELRILLLGDSVTFGWGAPIDATFGRRLETLLASKREGPVRTINAGVGGYNTVQQYAFFRSFVDIIEPEMVVLLYVRNDIESNDPPFDPKTELDLRQKTPPDVIRIVLGKSWLYRLGVFAFRYSRPARRMPLDKEARGVKESMDALSRIAALCRNRASTSLRSFTDQERNRRQSHLSPMSYLRRSGTSGISMAFPLLTLGYGGET